MLADLFTRLREEAIASSGVATANKLIPYMDKSSNKFKKLTPQEKERVLEEVRLALETTDKQASSNNK